MSGLRVFPSSIRADRRQFRVSRHGFRGAGRLGGELNLTAAAADGEQLLFDQCLAQLNVSLARPDLFERLRGEVADFDADERAEISFAAEGDARVKKWIEAAAIERRARRV